MWGGSQTVFLTADQLQLSPQIKPEAFGTDDVSVMRHNGIGTDACKARAVALEDAANNKVYRALAVLSAHSIRAEGPDIVDSHAGEYVNAYGPVDVMRIDSGSKGKALASGGF
jgi:hypothetical protein